jgi:hypothetical protein
MVDKILTMSRNLCLIIGISSQSWRELRGAIEYNVLIYRESLLQVLALIDEHRRTLSA